MPYALLLIAFMLIVVGIRGKVGALGTLVAGDFSGKNNFFYWLAALGTVGAVGYIPQARAVSRALLALIILGMLISDQSFFGKFVAALSSIQKPAPSPESVVGAASSDPATPAGKPGVVSTAQGAFGAGMKAASGAASGLLGSGVTGALGSVIGDSAIGTVMGMFGF